MCDGYALRPGVNVSKLALYDKAEFVEKEMEKHRLHRQMPKSRERDAFKVGRVKFDSSRPSTELALILIPFSLHSMPPAPNRRPVASRTRKVSPKSVPDVTPDELANRLAKRLTITDPKGKKKATPQSVETRRDDAMRAVNSASKSLSTIAESGWKASEPRQTTKRSSPGVHTHASVLAVASTAGQGLRLLRGLECNALDVERAAASVAGKLIILEMVSFLVLFLRVCVASIIIVPVTLLIINLLV